MNWTHILIIMCLASCTRKKKVDLIICHTNIYTVDSSFSKQQAMAIKDGKIMAIGTDKEIIDNYNADKVINAKGKYIYPGFIDAHCHFSGYGLSLYQVQLDGCKSYKEVLKKTKNFAIKTQDKTGWIIGRGWDHTLWENQQYPDKTSLDSLFPDQPVLLRRIGGHAALANQVALDIAGIKDQTYIGGGMIERKNNKLTGILIDKAVDRVLEKIPEADDIHYQKALLMAQENCFKVGLTSISDAGIDKNMVDLIDSLQQSGNLKIRVYAMLNPNNENLDYYLRKGKYKSERLNVCSFKFYADGALGSRGALLKKEYNDMSGHVGLLQSSEQYFLDHAQRIYESGFQMNTHCIGDSANAILLNIYKNVLKEKNNKRWRIEHAQIVDMNDMYMFADYSIIPSVQPVHATSDMQWVENRLGANNMTGAYAYKDLLNHAKLIAYGSDFPIENINPLHGFYAAVSRKDLDGLPENGFLPNQKLSRKEALYAMTIWAAYANFEEKENGSLECGKLADFILLDTDILNCEEKDIPLVKVLNTYVNGEKVY